MHHEVMDPNETVAAPESAERATAGTEAEANIDASVLLGEEACSTGTDALPPEQAKLRAVVEALIYVTEEPLTSEQIGSALEIPKDRVVAILEGLREEYGRPERGITIREAAGGYRMGTKPEHHEAIRAFVKKLKPPMKLSLAALETLSVIAYKQPITAPEIMEIRGVQGAGVLKTLLDRKLITPAGRKPVVGKPILYRTTKDFLLQFGLKDLAELPTLKEFEELRRLAIGDDDLAVLSEPSPPVEAADGSDAAPDSPASSEAVE